jgi:SNF2 family DNA or RNA helicase
MGIEVYKTKPMSHQQEALKTSANREYFAYFMEMGTGKTKVSIDNMTYLYHKSLINFVLVIAPNSVYMNWVDELSAHSKASVNIYRHKIDKKFIFKKDALNYYLMNVEAFSHSGIIKKIFPYIKQYEKTGCVIVDESTTIKNRSAKRTKNVIQACKGVRYKRILSGFPVTKNPLDLFSQCEFLRPGLLGTDNYYVYRATYCHLIPMTTPSGKVIQRPTKTYFNLDKLKPMLQEFSYRALKKDCLDLPDKIYHTRLIPMTKEQAEIYGHLKDYARAILGDKEATYANKLTEIIKLHQVANGFLVTDDQTVQDIPCNKIPELQNVLDETDGKAIIFANYIHNIKQIEKSLKEKYGEESTVLYYGDISVEQRHNNVHAFQNDSNVQFFVGNPATAGRGLTLTAANTVIYFSNNFNLEERVQSEDRAHRKGQTHRVNYVNLICDKTIDKFVLHALSNKLKISAQTLGEDVLEI